MKISNKIIKDAQYGDSEALDILFKDYSYFAYYYALDILHNIEDAEDCVQKSLNYLSKNLHTYDIKTDQYYGWGRSIIDKVIKNKIRDRKRYMEKYDHNEEAILSLTDTNIISNDFTCMLSQLERVIGKEKYKILMLKIEQNYQFTEIAKIMNLSLRTVKRRYSEAIKESREYFGE